MGDGREVQEEGNIYIYIYLWMIRVDEWQKPTQHCKAIILQLKFKNLKKKNLSVNAGDMGPGIGPGRFQMPRSN